MTGPPPFLFMRVPTSLGQEMKGHNGSERSASTVSVARTGYQPVMLSVECGSLGAEGGGVRLPEAGRKRVPNPEPRSGSHPGSGRPLHPFSRPFATRPGPFVDIPERRGFVKCCISHRTKKRVRSSSRARSLPSLLLRPHEPLSPLPRSPHTKRVLDPSSIMFDLRLLARHLPQRTELGERTVD